VGLILQFLESATLTASTPSPATVTVNTGLPGPKGDQGDAATIDVASTTTLPPGSSATVTNVGTTSAASLAFGVPRGDVGATGATGQKGDKGDTGATGAGVATGGVTNQILAKTSNANFQTGWVNAPDLAPYLLSATAASTYLTQSNAASTYATQTALASYLTTAVASSTYQTLAGMSSYLTTATAASTYATISSVALKSPLASPTFTGTVTIPSGASISGYLTTATAATTYAVLAPNDGSYYLQKNGAWEVVNIS
jgi:hypothetical protein